MTRYNILHTIRRLGAERDFEMAGATRALFGAIDRLKRQDTFRLQVPPPPKKRDADADDD